MMSGMSHNKIIEQITNIARLLTEDASLEQDYINIIVFYFHDLVDWGRRNIKGFDDIKIKDNDSISGFITFQCIEKYIEENMH